MKKIMYFFITLLFGLYSVASHASNSPLDISLIYGGIQDNKMVVFFNIKSPKGIKTYWKNPGFGGIAPEFAFDNNQNIDDIDILYNMPKISTQSGVTNYTLKKNDYIAVTFTPTDPSLPVTLKGSLTYGYCDILCKSDSLKFNESFSINQDDNATLLKKFFTKMPAPITPDMKLDINNVSALYDNKKNLLISFKIEGLKNLDENKFIYYIDSDFEINKPIIKKTDSDKYQISLDLLNIYKKPKYLSLLFTDNNGKNIMAKRKIHYNGKQ